MGMIEEAINLVVNSLQTLAGNNIKISNEAKFFREQKGIPADFNIVDQILKNYHSSLDKKALGFGGDVISWKELKSRVYGYQEAYEQLGIYPNSRVAIISLDSNDMALAILSLMFRGCTVILINPVVGAEGVHYQLETAKIDVALTDDKSALLYDSKKSAFNQSPASTPRCISLSILVGIYLYMDSPVLHIVF